MALDVSESISQEKALEIYKETLWQSHLIVAKSLRKSDTRGAVEAYDKAFSISDLFEKHNIMNQTTATICPHARATNWQTRISKTLENLGGGGEVRSFYAHRSE